MLNGLNARGSLVLAAVVAGLSLTPVAGWAASKPVLLVVPPEKIADPEYIETRKALEGGGITVEVAGMTTKVATGYGDLKVTPDLTIEDARVDRYAGVVVIGGEGTINHLWSHAGLQKLVTDAAKADEWVAAICAAPVVLARAGLLKGKAATSYPDEGIVSQLKAQGADYKTDQVVVDGRFVTGNGPDASAAFGQKLTQLIAAK